LTSPALGMLFGLINTTTLHLAKGLQRQGIDTLRWRSQPRSERSPARAAIYVAGVVLNNLTAVWIVLANRFAAPAYATGMFGLGLVMLLLYSHFVLGEPVVPLNYAGALAVVAGTALFAIHAFARGRIDVSAFHAPSVAIFSAVYVAVGAVFVGFALRGGSRILLAVSVGLFAGGMASLDPVLKALGQNAGTEIGRAGIIPAANWGWIPYGLSFVLGTVAFFTVQYAFLRGADASAMVPIHSSAYVLVPVVVQLIALPGYTAGPALVAGMVLIVVGIGLTQAGGTGT